MQVWVVYGQFSAGHIAYIASTAERAQAFVDPDPDEEYGPIEAIEVDQEF